MLSDTPAIESHDPEQLSEPLLPIGFGDLIALVFTMLQRRKQRFVVLAWVLGLMTPVEAVHQTEEALFFTKGRNPVAWGRAFETANDRFPTKKMLDLHRERTLTFPTDSKLTTTTKPLT